MAATKIKKRQIENLQIVDIDVAAAANIAMSKIAGLTSALDGKEAAFTKNSAFNKNFGTEAGTVAEGDHTHDAADIVSGILNVDRIPSLDLSKITGLQLALDGKEDAFSKNTAFNKNFGTTAGTVSEGNHTHTFASLTGKPTTLAGYGITDAFTKTEVQSITGDLANLETTEKSNLVSAINEINGIVADAVKPPLPLDCSGNPDYPPASAGDSYKVTVAGKIGGENGVSVGEGDLIIASVDNPGGDQATVGADWGVYESNIDKATESVFGTGRIATAAEVDAGTNDQAWVTPLKLTSKLGGYVQSATLGDYYTKADLQTGGQAQVDWDNVTNTPVGLQGYGIANAVASELAPEVKSQIIAGSDINLIQNTSLVYAAANNSNVPSWVTTDGAVLTLRSSSDVYRQFWFGRLGEVGVRAGIGGTQYNEDWIRLATQAYSDANYLNLSSEKDAFLPIVNANAGVDVNNIGGANAFYTNQTGNPNTPATGPFLSLQASSNYGGQLSIRAGDISGTTDEWYYRSTFNDGTGTWFRIASREWVDSQNFITEADTDSYASIDPSIANYTGVHPSIADLNTVNSTGIFRAANAINSPFTGILGIFQSSQSENSYAFQLIGGISSGDDMLAYRVRDNLGAWGATFRAASREWVTAQNYLTQSSLNNYVTTNTSQEINGVKKFLDRIDVDGPAGIGDRQIRFYSDGNSAWSIGMSTGDNFIINGWDTEGVAFNALGIGPDGNSNFKGTVSGLDAAAENQFVTLGQADDRFFSGDPTNTAIDANSLLGVPGFKYANSISSGSSNLPVDGFGTLLTGYGTNNSAQIFLPNSTAFSPYFRQLTSTGGVWREFWHSGNFDAAEVQSDITALEQDVSAINQDITAIENELDGVVSATNYVVRESLTGAKDGVNKSFTLANAPAAGKEMIFLNGQLLSAGGDYTITGATVTLTAGQEAPVADDVILGTYIH